MKILYISGESVPGEVGGSIHILEVAKNLNKLGHETTILSNKCSNQKKKEYFEGVKIIRTKVNIFGNTFPVLHMIKMCSLAKFDLIIERYSVVGGTGALISKIFKIPLIMEVNGPHLYEAEYLGKIKNKLIIKYLKMWSNFQFRTSKRIIAPLKTIIPCEFFNKFQQIEWGVNSDLFNRTAKIKRISENIKKELNIGNFNKIFVFHGSFRAWHGVEIIIELAKKLKNEGKEKIAGFLLIGSGDSYNTIKEEINISKLKNVIIHKSVSYTDLPKYIAIADIGIAPFNTNAYEPLKFFGFYWSPLKIFEYMAMKLPILTSDIGRVKEITGNNNFYFKENDLKDLEKQVIKIANTAENSLFHIGEINRLRAVNKFTWFQHAKKIDYLIKSIKNG